MLEQNLSTVASLVRPMGSQLEPLLSPTLLHELPGLTTAFDGEAMRSLLQDALFGVSSENAVIERCEPGQALYPAGDGCTLRFELDVRDNAGQAASLLLTGRLFPDAQAASAYVREQLQPLAEGMRGRPEVRFYQTPVALLEALNMAVYAFPIDGGVPTLVAATDRQQVSTVLSKALDGFAISDCAVELAQYGRRNRCTLRYIANGTEPGSDTPQVQVVYGKVAADGSGVETVPVIAALREQRSTQKNAFQFNVPRILGYESDLKLLLLESIPGKPRIKQLLKAELSGQAAATSGGLTLENAMDACAHMAAAIHTSAISLGERRTLDSELDWQRAELATVQRISPELGAYLLATLERLAEYAAQSASLPLGFAHGDFTYTQLIFDDAQSGLVDFDTVCQAEPALDLGQFLSYQRLAIARDKHGLSPVGIALSNQICQRFLDTYLAARDLAPVDEELVRNRTLIYEVVSLLRLALHSWQKLKVSRLDHVINLLEERMSWLR